MLSSCPFPTPWQRAHIIASFVLPVFPSDEFVLSILVRRKESRVAVAQVKITETAERRVNELLQ